MKIIINMINTVSAGTLATGKDFLAALTRIRTDHSFVVVIPAGFGYEQLPLNNHIELISFPRRRFNNLWRLWFDSYLFPRLVSRWKAEAVIVMGNHAPVRLAVPKVVLFRNSYYVDIDKFQFENKLRALTKYVERQLFGLTVRTTDLMIAQSNYMRQRLIEVWQISPNRVKVIPNAVSDTILTFAKQPQDTIHNDKNFSLIAGRFCLIYASRYYPHKNHAFLIEMARYLRDKNRHDIVIVVTLNPSLPAVEAILVKLRRERLEEFFINIGEVSQTELASWYTQADILFFPSLLETFGNAFVEAMAFGLPICAIDLPYARSVCDDAAVYFQPENVEDALRLVDVLKNDREIRRQLSEKGQRHLAILPNWDEVAEKYLNLIEYLTFAQTTS